MQQHGELQPRLWLDGLQQIEDLTTCEMGCQQTPGEDDQTEYDREQGVVPWIKLAPAVVLRHT